MPVNLRNRRSSLDHPELRFRSDVPTPVIADALSFHSKYVTRVWTEAGGTWKTCPGDHSR